MASSKSWDCCIPVFSGCVDVIRLWVIKFYFLRSAIYKCRTVKAGLSFTEIHQVQHAKFQTCWIEFRPGKHASHSIQCIVSISSMFFTRRAVCSLENKAKLCWGGTNKVGSEKENKGIASGCCVSCDMKSRYLLWIYLGRESTVPNDMQVLADFTSYHNIFLFFLVLLSPRTKIKRLSHSRLNRELSAKTLGFNHVASNLHIQQSIFFREHRGLKSSECRPLAYVHRDLKNVKYKKRR